MSSLPDQPHDLPESLTRDLHSLYARGVPIPESIDVSILADARAGFARRRRFRLALRGAVIAAGAAAAAMVVLAVRLSDPNAPSTPGTPALARAEDVDHSGRVDILDAFVVARLIEVEGQLDRPAAYDVNGDGAIDRADVDRIAMAAVDTTPHAGVDGRPQ